MRHVTIRHNQIPSERKMIGFARTASDLKFSRDYVGTTISYHSDESNPTHPRATKCLVRAAVGCPAVTHAVSMWPRADAYSYCIAHVLENRIRKHHASMIHPRENSSLLSAQPQHPNTVTTCTILITEYRPTSIPKIMENEMKFPGQGCFQKLEYEQDRQTDIGDRTHEQPHSRVAINGGAVLLVKAAAATTISPSSLVSATFATYRV